MGGEPVTRMPLSRPLRRIPGPRYSGGKVTTNSGCIQRSQADYASRKRGGSSPGRWEGRLGGRPACEGAQALGTRGGQSAATGDSVAIPWATGGQARTSNTTAHNRIILPFRKNASRPGRVLGDAGTSLAVSRPYPRLVGMPGS